MITDLISFALASFLLAATISEGHVYGRGAGYASESACETAQCEADEPHHLCTKLGKQEELGKTDTAVDSTFTRSRASLAGQDFVSQRVCEKWLSIWYPKCKPGYKNVACCLCSDELPEDN